PARDLGRPQRSLGDIRRPTLPAVRHRLPPAGSRAPAPDTMSDSAVVDEDCLKLTTYFGERDRADGGFLADAFTEIYARHELQTSLVMRGVEGFGARHHLRTDRLLTLSEDLPLVSVAVDTTPRIEGALHEVEALDFHG